MSISLTDNLVKHIKSLQAKQGNEDLMLRVAVNGGGCQGFEYEFDLAETIEDDDEVIEQGGVKVLIDSVSLEYLLGSTIDYKDELIGAHIHIDNPNAQSSCGCGTSFSV